MTPTLSIVWAVLIRARARQHDAHGSDENFQIEPERPARRIAQIEPDHVVEAQPASTRDLPEPGDAGLRLEHAPPMPHVIALELVGNRRARADERHLAFEAIEQMP